jgi:RES domain-containing protein
MELYRIVHTRWADRLIASGRAARWNSNGVFIIYASFSRSLACLENTVHYSGLDLTASFRVMVLEAPGETYMEEINSSVLPANWHLSDPETYNKCRFFGDDWYARKSSVLLKVPSALITSEYNCLINTTHPEFNLIRLLGTEPFFFDSRIKKR